MQRYKPTQSWATSLPEACCGQSHDSVWRTSYSKPTVFHIIDYARKTYDGGSHEQGVRT